jgi:hypothetical protein
MRKLTGLLAGALGLAALVAFILVVALLFGGLSRRGAVPTVTPPPTPTRHATPTVVPTRITPPPLQTPTQPSSPLPTPTPQGLRAENLRIEREVQLTFDGRNTFSSGIYWSPGSDKVMVNKLNGQTIQGVNVTYLLTDMWVIPIAGQASQMVVPNAYGGIWSPNRRKILYHSQTAADRQNIYVMDDDGSNRVQVAAGSPSPAYWFNNAEIVYMEQGRLWVANIADRSIRILNAHVDLTPGRSNQWHKPYALSPESGKLAYVDRFQLWLIGISETQARPIADNLSPGSDSMPNLAWSPRGQQLAYTAYITDTRAYKPGLWVVNADGRNPHLLATGIETDLYEHPFWFPGETVIGFSKSSSGTNKLFKVYVVNNDGSHPTDLTGDRGSQEFPKLSPDGTKLAFFRDGNLWVAFLATN